MTARVDVDRKVYCLLRMDIAGFKPLEGVAQSSRNEELSSLDTEFIDEDTMAREQEKPGTHIFA